MVKTEIKVKSEQLYDADILKLFLETFVVKINHAYGRNLSLHSWQIDEREEDKALDVKTLELSLK